MLAINEVRTILNDEKLTDEQIRQIRDVLYGLAEVILENLGEKRQEMTRKIKGGGNE